MEFLLWVLLFLSGWFVCWIQMVRFQSRKAKYYLSEYRKVLQELESLRQPEFESQMWKSKYPAVSDWDLQNG